MILLFLLPLPMLATEIVTKTDVQKKQITTEVFQLDNPDYKLSPYTGMTRKHWKDAAVYLLKGAFSYVTSIDDALVFPKQAGKSYPTSEKQLSTERLEGLCRTLFIAAPLLKEDSNLVVNGIRLADYYRHQIVMLTDPKSNSYIASREKNGGPHQNLVEFGALSVSMFIIPDILWKPLFKEQKDALANCMLSYGNGPTWPNNWRFFNVFIMSYFKSAGYKVNDELMADYLNRTLAQYSGDGWYQDTPAYDYYSMWAFQMYGVLWSEFYGRKNFPEIAQKLQENFKPLKNNYPYIFSRNGEMIMWGRSISYRFGSIIPFPLMGFENSPETNYGWMRRIASGTLLQFLQQPAFLKDNVPTLGFYGEFEPAVQSYSCRGSAFWCGKAFLGLLVPENNPFWQSEENEGAWAKELQKNSVVNRFQNGSNILITDYPNIGASEVRAWCNVPTVNQKDNYRGEENYNRLSYNSAFPWQKDGANGEVAMGYLIKAKTNRWEHVQKYTFKKFEKGIYYRDAELINNKNVKLKLADIPLVNGILRVDKLLTSDSIDIKLGHYALPKMNGVIKHEQRKINGFEVKIIDNGVYQLAMINLKGWTKLQFLQTKGLHPVAKESEVLNVHDQFYPNQKEKEYITLMMWKKSGEIWNNDELLPVKSIKQLKKSIGLVINFKNGESKTVLFQ
ncbi:MAG: DUF2264 domain-containing protein [Paludibacter sp.]